MAESVEMSDRPLVTFALFAYNQEKYIREAVEGALAQSYSPLEIILSDDSSQDSTFEVMSEIVDNYSGKHEIKLNRNDRNMGISSHVRYIHEISRGEIIIHAAGDDISLPERTALIVKAFSESSKRPSMVISNALKIDKGGSEVGLLNKKVADPIEDFSINPLKGMVPGVNGCTAAITRELVERFPKPIEGIMAEDVVLLRRAYLLNGVYYLPDVLVKYRVGAGGVSVLIEKSRKYYLDHSIKWTKDRIKRIDQLIIDIQYSNFNDLRIIDDIKSLKVNIEKRLVLLQCDKFIESLFYLMNLIFLEIFSFASPKNVLRDFLVRWFPSIVGYKP